MSREKIKNMLSTPVVEERTAELDREMFVCTFKRTHNRLSFVQGSLRARRAFISSPDFLALVTGSRIIA